MAIADTGKAEAQPLSPEVWEAQQTELERLARRVAELEEENRAAGGLLGKWQADNEALRARVAELEADHERTWRCLRDGHSAHALILRGDIAVSRRQLAHLLGEAYQELFAKLECGADTPKTPQKSPSLPQEPPVVVSGVILHRVDLGHVL